MSDEDLAFNRQIAARVRQLREKQGLALATLANQSGVSKSMISLIERGESNPTAVVLAKLASALGVSTASIFEDSSSPSEASPLSKKEMQNEWRDPASGYLRRNLSPAQWPSALQLVEVQFPGGEKVCFDNHSTQKAPSEQIWLLEGQMHITVGEHYHQLKAGDCLAVELNQPTIFYNPLKKPARYLVAITNAK